MDTIRMAARLNTTTAAFGIMVPYPGTKGNALELENLTRKELERLQARAYLWFYLRNFRILDLSKFAWEKRKAVGKIARKILPGGRTSHPDSEAKE